MNENNFELHRSHSSVRFDIDSSARDVCSSADYDFEDQTQTSLSSSPSLNQLISSTSGGNTNASSESDDETSRIELHHHALLDRPSHSKHGRNHNYMMRNAMSSSTLSSLGTLSKLPKTKKRKLHRAPTLHSRSRASPFTLSSIIIKGLKWIFTLWCISLFGVVIYQMKMDQSDLSIPSLLLHIPLPAPNHKVSVVLMNHSRPRMIKESAGLMPTLLKHPSVDEIILLHSNPKTAFKYIHPKVVNIDASKENNRMGLSIRFHFCQLAKNDWVIHVDDDMEFTEQTLNELLTEFSKNTHRIVGKFGRDRKENSFFNGYTSKSTSKETEVVLTKLMVMEREICSAFFQYSNLIWEDVVLNSSDGPLWNGEDIFMSLVANHVYGREKNNYAMDWLDVRDAPNHLKDYKNGILDISGGFQGFRPFDYYWWLSLLARNRHYAYRGSMWGVAKERLSRELETEIYR